MTRSLGGARSGLVAVLAVSLLTLSVVVLVGTAGGSPAAAISSSCQVSTAYLAQGSPTALFREDVADGGVAFRPVGPAVTSYNAMGLDPVSGQLFAVAVAPAADSNALLEIDPATGAVTSHGQTRPPLPSGLNGGAFGPDRKLYLTSSDSAALEVVDVATGSATSVALDSPPGTADVTYSDGYLWGFTGSGPPAGQIVRIDPVSGAVRAFPFASIPAGATFGSAFEYGNGNLAFGSNSGGVYQVAVDGTPTDPSFTLVSAQSSPAASSSDGASCTSMPTDLAISADGTSAVPPGAPAGWQVTVRDNGPSTSSGSTIEVTLPVGFTGISAGAGCGVAALVVTCTTGPVPPGGSSTVTVRATAPASTGCGDLQARVVGDEAEPATAEAGANNDTTRAVCVSRPTIADVASSGIVQPGGSLSDRITVSGTGGVPGSANWSLLGPIGPRAEHCVGLDWGSAPTRATGTIATSGDGQYESAAMDLATAGCYSYSVTLTFAAPIGGLTPTAAGEPDSTALVPLGALSVEVSVDRARATSGQQLTFTVVIGNSTAATAANLQLTTLLPPGVRVVGHTGTARRSGRALHWTVVPVPPGGSSRMSVLVQIVDRTEAETLTASVRLQNPTGYAPVVVGTPCSGHPELSCVTTEVAAPSNPATSSRPALAFTALPTAPAEYRPGEVVPWHLTVSNPTAEALLDVRVSVPAVAACSMPVGTVPPHGTAVVSCYTVATESLTPVATMSYADGHAHVATAAAGATVIVAGGLARTGSNVRAELWFGLGLAGLGVLLVALRRRS
jgi:uncharacterized repeat protein (TIGR01451 family)